MSSLSTPSSSSGLGAKGSLRGLGLQKRWSQCNGPHNKFLCQDPRTRLGSYQGMTSPKPSQLPFKYRVQVNEIRDPTTVVQRTSVEAVRNPYLQAFLELPVLGVRRNGSSARAVNN